MAGGSRYRMRRDFAVAVVRVALEDAAASEKQAMLQAILGCAGGHLKTLELPWSSAHGVWCRLVRVVAGARIAGMAAGLGAGMEPCDAGRVPCPAGSATTRV